MGFIQTLFTRERSAASNAPTSSGSSADRILDIDRLLDLARARAGAYAEATPFPHVVIDGFISLEDAARVATEFPARGDTRAWLDFNGSDATGRPLQRNKYHISDEDRLGPVTQRLLYELKTARFLEVLTALTGIAHLIPDALNHGGGIHMNCRGAMLKIHADFNRHPEWHLDRRLNLLLYLNADWQAGFGGDLELWDGSMRSRVRTIEPIAGRCVIFSTSSTSYHGHPDPIDCPEHVTRKSVALYYYTQQPGLDHAPSHSTLWQARPGSED